MMTWMSRLGDDRDRGRTSSDAAHLVARTALSLEETRRCTATASPAKAEAENARVLIVSCFWTSVGPEVRC